VYKCGEWKMWNVENVVWKMQRMVNVWMRSMKSGVSKRRGEKWGVCKMSSVENEENTFEKTFEPAGG